MKFLVENELEKRHKKHKKTIKPGAIGSFIHPDGGNSKSIETFNNSVNIDAVSNPGLSESINEDYVEDKLMRLISIQHVIRPSDNIQLHTTEKGNYLVTRNGKKIMILGKENFRESEIDDLRLNGYFDEYDEERISEGMSRLELMKINKQRYADLEKEIAQMSDGIEKDVAQTLGLRWIKGRNWEGGLGSGKDVDKLYQNIMDKYGVDFETVEDIFNKKFIDAAMKESLNEEVADSDTANSIKEKIIKAIQDEWKTIALYNDLIDTLKEAEMFDEINVIEDINEEEHIHVGQLQSLLSILGGDATAIEQGEQEAAEQLTESLKEQEDKINDFIEDSRGYSDYNQLIDDVADEFNLSKKEAENYVWEYFYNEGHSVENSYTESINLNDALAALRNFKKSAEYGDSIKLDVNGEKVMIQKEYDGWYLTCSKARIKGPYKHIEATINDILNRNSENNIFLSEDYSKEEKKADFINALKLCAAYDPNTLYIDNYSQKQAAEAKNREINTAFDKIMTKYNVKSTGVPAECTNLKSASDYINKLKQYIAENKKVMKESFDPYSIEYWNYDSDEIEVGVEYCENNSIDPHSLTPTDFENIVILANGYYPHNEGWKYTDAEILSALDYVLEKGIMLSSLTPENFEEIIKKANELDECAKMTNKEIKESLNKLDMWAIDNDATFYDLKTLYEAFINPNSPIDQKKKDKIQKALNDPTMNRDTEKLQDYIAGILVRQDEALEETLEDEEEFNTFKISYPNYNKKFDYKKFGEYFDKNGHLIPEKAKEYWTEFNKPLTEDVKSAVIPKPYDEYFEVDNINVSDDDFYDYKPGDEIDGYDCHFIAYLIPKTEEVEDIYPVLTDDPKYPVCELIAGRLIPVDLPEDLS